MIPNTPQPEDYAHLSLYLTPPHPCGYFPERRAATLFVDPAQPMNGTLYQYLLERGFRRSGDHVYRPYCGDCDACIPVRVPVARFAPGRSMRRVRQRNRDLRVRISQPRFDRALFELYERYLNHRHRGGPMENPRPVDFLEFLTSRWCRTRFVEFWLQERLLMVAVTDLLPDALSAVYTFFDPGEAARSLGSHAILWQIAECRTLNRSALYLGYWIRDCGKMRYKARFRPLEMHRGARWIDLDAADIPGRP